MTVDELDLVDRATLRAWRLSNVVGWGFAGAVVASLTSIVVLRVLIALAPFGRALGVGSVGILGTILVIAAAAVLVALATGWTVGAHVYRWPGLVAAAAMTVPGSLWTFGGGVPRDLAQMAISMSLVILAAVLAGLVARTRFRRRPRALRAPEAR